MKVYIVFWDSLGTWRVLDVFTTEEKAQECVETNGIKCWYEQHEVK